MKATALLLLIGLFVQVAILAYVYTELDSQRKQDIHETKVTQKSVIKATRRGCERGKEDRRANADFQRAQSAYILKVTRAASVKEDVKRAAREARKVFTRTSSDLTERSKINCKKAYP